MLRSRGRVAGRSQALRFQPELLASGVRDGHAREFRIFRYDRQQYRRIG